MNAFKNPNTNGTSDHLATATPASKAKALSGKAKGRASVRAPSKDPRSASKGTGPGKGSSSGAPDRWHESEVRLLPSANPWT